MKSISFPMDVELIVKDIIKGLQNGPYQDISDVGNIIGMALDKVPEMSEDGNDLNGFNFGIRHGMDLKHGDHMSNDYGVEAMTDLISKLKSMPDTELLDLIKSADKEHCLKKENTEKFPYIPPLSCVKCGRVLESLDTPDYGMVRNGVVGKLYSPYGSENDGTVFQIGICDECIKATNLKPIGDYMW